MTYPSPPWRGAPGYGRPCAAPSVPVSDRSRPAPMAPPGHALASAGTSVPITTAPLPARVSRLHQERLASITATPNNRTYPQSLQDTPDNRPLAPDVRTSKHSDRSSRHTRRLDRPYRLRRNPRPPVTTGGPQGGHASPTRATNSHLPTHSLSHRHTANHRLASTPPLYRSAMERGPGDGPKPHHTWHYPCGFGPSAGEESHTTHPAHPPILSILSINVNTTYTTHPPLTAPTAARRPPPTAAGMHPATQAPTRPSPTTTATGASRQPPSRAPPLVIAAQATIHVPPPQRGDHRGARGRRVDSPSLEGRGRGLGLCPPSHNNRQDHPRRPARRRETPSAAP